jgi:acyl transferase domain-containing protein
VGIAVRVAGADSPEELWTLLSEGRSAVAPVPRDRPAFLHPLTDMRPHWAGLLDDVARFDAELFGVSPREAEQMDPQLRLFLEVAWRALEDAGCAGAGHDADTGVFAGVMYGDYGARANQAAGADSPYRCWAGFSLANRLSQLLGFSGPSLAVDTACSSSGTALHLACAALRAGDCRVAVAGGVNLILDPDRFGSLGRLGILSERGQCEPFGADADGTVLGEGAGVVVLRPLEEARRRGDRIYGVIKGTGLSTGSGTVGFTAPNPQAQAQAIRRGLVAAQVDPRTISYVETHGTGTALGDPIEVRGLSLAYASPELQDPAQTSAVRCTLGSIKPNLGHLEAGAGMLGLIKVLLQFEHRQLLPSITSRLPNPQIPFAQTPFDVQRTLEPWHRQVVEVNGASIEIPRRAGVSSFGVGGANAHIVLEEVGDQLPTSNSQLPSSSSQLPVASAFASSSGSARRGGPSGPPETVERPVHLLTLSARGEQSLRRQAMRLREHIERHVEVPPADLCFTLNTGRKHVEHRLAVPVATRDDLLQALRAFEAGGVPRGGAAGRASTPAPAVAFLFTGQGSQ